MIKPIPIEVRLSMYEDALEREKAKTAQSESDRREIEKQLRRLQATVQRYEDILSVRLQSR